MITCYIYRLRENHQLLRQRLEAYQNSMVALEENLKEEAIRNRNFVAEMNALKPEVKRLYKLREQYKK